MRQFDLYENPVAAMPGAVPFVVVLPSHHAAGLTEAIIAPVMRGRTAILLVSVTGMIAIRQIDLRRKAGSLAHHEDDIRRALDRLFTGF